MKIILLIQCALALKTWSPDELMVHLGATKSGIVAEKVITKLADRNLFRKTFQMCDSNNDGYVDLDEVFAYLVIMLKRTGIRSEGESLSLDSESRKNQRVKDWDLYTSSLNELKTTLIDWN